MESRRLLAASTSANYLPEDIVADSQGVIYLLDQDEREIHRWSTSEEEYLDPIQLGDLQSPAPLNQIAPSQNQPTQIALSDDESQIYVGYASGAITTVDFADNLTERLWAVSPGGILELQAIDGFVLAISEQLSDRLFQTIALDGSFVDDERVRRSDIFVWSAETRRVFYTRDYLSPNDVHWKAIGTNGQFTDEGESPYHGGFTVSPPLVASDGHGRLALGGGVVFKADTLTIDENLGQSFFDAAWTSDGHLLTIRANNQNNRTIVSQWDEHYQPLGEQVFLGRPLDIIAVDDAIILVTESSQLQFFPYTTTAYLDLDGDGVAIDADRFPDDIAASVDTDGDGAPDAWNDGRGESDSTTRLELDAFPLDSACQFISHAAEDDTCDPDSFRRDFDTYPYGRSTTVDNSGVVYVLPRYGNLILRWSMVERRYLNPIFVHDQPERIIFAEAINRIYLNYSDGLVTQLDPDQDIPQESPYIRLPRFGGTEAVGQFFIAHFVEDGNARLAVFDSDGNKVSDQPTQENVMSRSIWDPHAGRIIYRSDSSIRSRNFNPETGELENQSETIGAYGNNLAITLSPDGTRIFSSVGVFDSTTGKRLSDDIGNLAVWLDDGGLITADRKVIREFDADLQQVNIESVEGSDVVALAQYGTAAFLFVSVNGGTDYVKPFEPNADQDGDGVPFWDDVFPHDIAASIDDDSDGFPDRWNDGFGTEDSTTGLTLDLFPTINVCNLAEHAMQDDPGRCDIGRVIPEFVPQRIVSRSNGDIYLLSEDDRAIYQWSSSLQSYTDAVLFDSGIGDIALSSDDSKLYVGDVNGEISEIDLDTGLRAQSPLVDLGYRIEMLTAVGNFLYADTSLRAHTINQDGLVVEKSHGNSGDASFTVDQNRGRIYFSGRNSRYLDYVDVNLVTGETTNSLLLLLYGQPPVRVSADGQNLIDGTGSLFQTDSTPLESRRFLPVQIDDASWLGGNELLTIRELDSETLLERWDVDLLRTDLRRFPGTPHRVLQNELGIFVVTIQDGRPSLSQYVPSADADDDGVENLQDAFPLDVTASVDSDRDEHPDQFNDGFTAQDSNLVRDAFPFNSACQTIEHARPDDDSLCDTSTAFPRQEPADFAIDDNGIVYLLSPESDRVFRWSTLDQTYLDPIVIREFLGASRYYTQEDNNDLYPRLIEYSSAHNRIYLGYDREVTMIDVEDPLLREQSHLQLPERLADLHAEGSYLFVVSAGNTWAIDESGLLDETLATLPLLAFNEPKNRVYYYDYPDFLAATIDPETGRQGETSVPTLPGNVSTFRARGEPHFSPDGHRVAFSEGAVLDADSFNLIGFVPPHVDAGWTTDGSMVVIAQQGGGSVVRQFDHDLNEQSVRRYPGAPQAIYIQNDLVTVVTTMNDGVEIHNYVSTIDADQDGVNDGEDAFEFDVAASQDRDRDGAPDQWNDGFAAEDSTTGLSLDVFPDDAACQVVAHASEHDSLECDIAAQMPSFDAGRVAVDQAGIVYLLDAAIDRVHRWSSIDGRFLNPIYLHESPTTIESFDDQIYVGYASGHLRRFVTSSSISSEELVVQLTDGIVDLEAAGELLLAAIVGFGRVALHADGSQPAPQTGYVSGAENSEWNDATAKRFRLDYRLRSETLDRATGAELEAHETSRFEEINPSELAGPVRPAIDGQLVLLGSGHLFFGDSLALAGRLPFEVTDASWLVDGTFVTIRPGNTGPAESEADQTIIERWDRDLRVIDRQIVNDTPRHLIHTGDQIVLVTDVEGKPQFSALMMPDDSDGDGFAFAADAFPLDPAISLDRDRDGIPDQWNDGFDSSELAPDLTIDVFPDDPSCHSPAHAVLGESFCVSPFTAATMDADESGTLYFMNTQHNRINRWSAVTSSYLAPVPIGDGATTFAFSAVNNRLYVGYADGEITQIDLATDEFVEIDFVPGLEGFATDRMIDWIRPTDEFVYVVSYNHRTYEFDGTLIDSQYGSRTVESIEWVRSTSIPRVAYSTVTFYNSGPQRETRYRSLFADGQISAAQDPNALNKFAILSPVRVSPLGNLLVNGRGDLYRFGSSIAYASSLPVVSIVDAAWLNVFSLATIRADDQGNTILEQWLSDSTFQHRQRFNGTPLAIFKSGPHTVVVTNHDGATSVRNYESPSGDQLAVASTVSGEANREFSLEIGGHEEVASIFGIQVSSNSDASADPIDVQILSDGGTDMRLVDYVQNSPQEGTVAVASLLPGTYRVRVSGALELQGSYRVQLSGPGLGGSSQAERERNLQRAESILLHGVFPLGENVRRVVDDYLGIDLASGQLDEALDINGNGVIDTVDVVSLRDNFMLGTSRPPVDLVELGGVSGQAGAPTAMSPGPIRIRDLTFSIFRNPIDVYDVNGDGRVSALDALRLLNVLAVEPNPLIPSDTVIAGAGTSMPDLFFDVSGDSRLSALDLLHVINALADAQFDSINSEGESISDARQDIYAEKPLERRWHVVIDRPGQDADDTNWQQHFGARIPQSVPDTTVSDTGNDGVLDDEATDRFLTHHLDQAITLFGSEHPLS